MVALEAADSHWCVLSCGWDAATLMQPPESGSVECTLYRCVFADVVVSCCSMVWFVAKDRWSGGNQTAVLGDGWC